MKYINKILIGYTLIEWIVYVSLMIYGSIMLYQVINRGSYVVINLPISVLALALLIRIKIAVCRSAK